MKTFLNLMAILILGTNAISQEINNLNTLHDQYTFEKSKANALGTDRYSMIAGSPYLSEEFKTGEVIINDSVRYKEIPLRYNIFTDRMEYTDAQERVLEVNTSINRFTFLYDDHLFKLVQFNDGTQIKKGLLELIVDGKTRLYRKYIIEIKAGSPPKGYQAATPAKFIRKKDQFLLATDDNIPILISRRKDLIRKLEEVNPEIHQYLKENRVRIGSEQSLIKLIRFSNYHVD
jgi:hypothetical protein